LLKLRLQLPPRSFWPTFWREALPLMVFQLTKSFVWGMLSATAAMLDVVSCAAHQAAWATWSVFCMVSFPLSQAAQVFLTEELATTGPGPGARRLVRLIVGLALALGCCLAVLCGGTLAFAPSAFVHDARLWPLMRAVAPHAAMSLVLTGSAQALEGVLIATCDTRFLSVAQIVNSILMAAWLRFAIQSGHGLTMLWPAITLFYLARVVQIGLRLKFRGLRYTEA